MIPDTLVPAARRRRRGSRRLSRELVLRALYAWQMTGADAASLEADAAATPEFAEANADFFAELLGAVLCHAPALDASLEGYLDRGIDQLSPIEHAALLIGAYELQHSLAVPYRVAINEAVDLAKRYGGTDGHKYVNGVLDRVAQAVRRTEVEAVAGA